MNKEFLKKLILGLIGLVALYFLRNEEGALGFVAFASLLFALYHLFPLVINLLIVDLPAAIIHILPQAQTSSTKEKSHDKLATKLLFALFISSILFLAFEIRNIDNTIHGMQLFWLFAGIGIPIAILVIIILNKLAHGILNDKGKKGYFIIPAVIISFFLLTPAIASMINRRLAKETIACKTYIVKEKSASRKRGGRMFYLMFIEIGMGEERFEIDEYIYNNIIIGDMIEICTRKGFFGYEVVKTFNPIIEQPNPSK